MIIRYANNVIKAIQGYPSGSPAWSLQPGAGQQTKPVFLTTMCVKPAFAIRKTKGE